MKAKHLTLDDRKAIQEGIERRLSKTAIAKSISKDPTTVAKEIKLHRMVKQRNRFNSPVMWAKLKECKKPRKFCPESCIDYLEQPCTIRDRSTGACNHCEKISRCRLDHYFYNANTAHEAYLFHLSNSRTEMDTVYNRQEGPYIQTFSYQNTCFMNGFIHPEKTSKSMASTFDYLQKLLGNDYFKLFSLILTDRGTEFEKVSLFELEAETGKLRTNIFYCDPQTPSQKPHLENNHNYVSNILPNGKKFEGLTQHDLNLLFSHINSVPRKVLGGRTPYDVFSFFYGKEIIYKIGIRRIDPDEVTLQPFLLKIE